jgi:hypothetical protein
MTQDKNETVSSRVFTINLSKPQEFLPSAQNIQKYFP